MLVFALLACSGGVFGVTVVTCVLAIPQGPVWQVTSLFVFGCSISVLCWLLTSFEAGIQVDQIVISINESIPLNIFFAIGFGLIYYCRIRVLCLLYNRQRDQTIIKVLGGMICFISLSLWCCSKFIPNSSLLFVDATIESRLVVLPTIVYLLRISLSVMSSCLVIVFMYSNKSIWSAVFNLKNPQSTPLKHMILTVLTIIAIWIPVLMFLLDLTNTYANLLSEIINITSDWLGCVSTMYWLNDLKTWVKIKQSTGVLGRREYITSSPFSLKRLNRFKNPIFRPQSRMKSVLLVKGNSESKTRESNYSKSNNTNAVFVHKVAKL